MFFKKNKTYKSNWWKLEYPKSWEMETSEECSTFYDPNGVGALQISEYKKDSPITESEVLETISENEKNMLSTITINDFKGFAIEIIEEENYWYKIYIFGSDLLLLVTYNCEADDKNSQELNKVKSIINSIKYI